MAKRPKKVHLIEMLKKQNKTFDPEANYNILYAMLDEGTVFPARVTRPDETEMQLPQELYGRARKAGLDDKEMAAYADADALLAHLDESFPVEEEEIEIKDGDKTLYTVTKDILERAKTKLGLTADRLKGYTSREALVTALNKMHPASNPAAKPQRGVAPKPSLHKPMKDKFEIESKMEAKFILQNRAQFDEGKLQEELRRINRVHGPGQPVKIVKTMTFKPVKGVNKQHHAVKYLVTKYEIFMK